METEEETLEDVGNEFNEYRKQKEKEEMRRQKRRDRYRKTWRKNATS